MKCSKLAYEKNAAAIIGSKKGDVFGRNFKSVEREEANKDKDITRKNKFPGRRF
ncbi:MAG: hypothetical protein V3V05_10035 [Pontiella sp.]